MSEPECSTAITVDDEFARQWFLGAVAPTSLLTRPGGRGLRPVDSVSTGWTCKSRSILRPLVLLDPCIR